MPWVRAAIVVGMAGLGACAGAPLPTYEFEAGYAPEVATPSGIENDLDVYAARICGANGHETLDHLYVGRYGPDYVRIRFICA